MGCGLVGLVNESEGTEHRPDNSTIVMVPLKGMAGKDDYDCTGTVRVPLFCKGCTKTLETRKLESSVYR